MMEEEELAKQETLDGLSMDEAAQLYDNLEKLERKFVLIQSVLSEADKLIDCDKLRLNRLRYCITELIRHLNAAYVEGYRYKTALLDYEPADPKE